MDSETEVDFKTTREVAIELGVNPKTLQLWVRQENVQPISNGSGRQRRLKWTPESIEHARRLRDRDAQESPLIAAMGPELIAALHEAKRAKDYQGDDDIVVAGPNAGRVFRSDTPLATVLRKLPDRVLLVMR